MFKKEKVTALPPVFFCENCGAEVPEDRNDCPACFKRFAGVKCPRCFFEGSPLQFTKGCPRCHYDPSKPQRPSVAAQAVSLPSRRRIRFFSSPTLVGIILIAIGLVVLLYML